MGMLDWMKQKVSTGAATVGAGLLGKGTGDTDATPQGRAYRLYKAEQEAQGLPAVSPEDFAAGKR